MKTEKISGKALPSSAAITELSHRTPLVRNRNSVARVPVQLAKPPEDALTQQQFKDECDINRIVQNAQRGIAPRYLAQGRPQYGDFSNVPDLAEAYTKIRNAEKAFLNLPAALRLELNNDPANINKLTDDQIARYKLGKSPASSSPSQPPPDPASPAGQAGMAPSGQPSSDDPAPKAGSKKSVKTDP